MRALEEKRLKTFLPVSSLLVTSVFLFMFFISVPALESAEKPGSAKRAGGRFESKKISMAVADAYAFYGKSQLGGKDKVIIVAASNQGFVPSELDGYWNRKNALERYFKDEKSLLVYFEFDTKGKYRGLSYYFGPGIGCGYCAEPSVQSTVKLNNGSLAGRISIPVGGDAGYSFDITVDVPVSGNDYGKAQGAGGGEPGKAYIAYHKSLSEKDTKAIRQLLSKERNSAWSGAEKKGKGAQFLSFLREDHPSGVLVTEAFIKGDHALLLLTAGKKHEGLKGEAMFIRENGSWRFEEETFWERDE